MTAEELNRFQEFIEVLHDIEINLKSEAQNDV